MLKKIIFSAVVVIGLGTTSVMAKSDTQLVDLASKQETLSHNINNAYKKQDNRSVLLTLKTLESGHKKLRSQINNPEISNLLVYLSLCLKDLKEIVQQPHTSQNTQKVADLSDSISEGNHYIIATL